MGSLASLEEVARPANRVQVASQDQRAIRECWAPQVRRILRTDSISSHVI